METFRVDHVDPPVKQSFEIVHERNMIEE